MIVKPRTAGSPAIGNGGHAVDCQREFGCPNKADNRVDTVAHGSFFLCHKCTREFQQDGERYERPDPIVIEGISTCS